VWSRPSRSTRCWVPSSSTRSRLDATASSGWHTHGYERARSRSSSTASSKPAPPRCWSPTSAPTGPPASPTLSPARLDALVARADALGFDVHVHAIGDRAVKMALDALERAQRVNPARERRHVIAHLELIDPPLTSRAYARWASPPASSRYGPTPTPTSPISRSQPSAPRARVGSTRSAARSRRAPRWVAGSDWSVSSMNPLEGIQVALTRPRASASRLASRGSRRRSPRSRRCSRHTRSTGRSSGAGTLTPGGWSPAPAPI
jgi:predicted amidohydrolase YtcJ